MSGDQYLKNTLDNYKQLMLKVKEKCVQRAKHEGMDKDEILKDPKKGYLNNIEAFAYDHLNYYQCAMCQEPYFGGHKRCGGGEEEKKEEPAPAAANRPGIFGGGAVGIFGGGLFNNINQERQKYKCGKCV